MIRDRVYGYGVFLVMLGGSGMAEHITSGRGSFIIPAIIFSIGMSCVLDWWIRKWRKDG